MELDRKKLFWLIILPAIILLGFYTFVKTGFFEWKLTPWPHFWLEFVGGVLAITVAGILFKQFKKTQETFYMYPLMGFLVAGIIDLLHAFVAIAVQAYGMKFIFSPVSVFIPGTWVAGRIFLGLMLFLTWKLGSKKIHPKQIASEMMIWGGLMGVIAIVITLIFVMFNMPAVILPQIPFFHRPYELLAGLFFLLALPFFFTQAVSRKNLFVSSLVVSIVAGLITQIPYMTNSSALLDTLFNLSHVTKDLSYAIPIIGYFWWRSRK